MKNYNFSSSAEKIVKMFQPVILFGKYVYSEKMDR